MARRKKSSAGESPAPTSTVPTTKPPVAAALVRLWSAEAGESGRWVLSHDTSRGVLMIAPEDDAMRPRLVASAEQFLRQNEYVADDSTISWSRPIDGSATFQDRLDAERVLLKVAEMQAGDDPPRPAGRRRR